LATVLLSPQMPRAPDSLCAGVIGPRGIGAVHLRELAALGVGELVVTSKHPERLDAAGLSARLGCPVSVAPSVEGLAEMADFVSICSPNALHLAHARAALERGCHVFVEKPLFWSDALLPAENAAACDELLAQSGGRLSVNYPTACFAAPFVAACGRPTHPREFHFRYQTRGGYRGAAIAVDLLPHAFSLLREFVPADTLTVVSRESSDNAWRAELDVAGVRCHFEFVQDSAASESHLSFAVDGRAAHRVQVPKGDGFAVALEMPGVTDSPISIENPMRTTIACALSACESETPAPGEPARSAAIMCLIASSLVE
jgi:predicted dehydrogenase